MDRATLPRAVRRAAHGDRAEADPVLCVGQQGQIRDDGMDAPRTLGTAFANDPSGSRSRPRMSKPRPPYSHLAVALGFWVLGLGALPAIARAEEPVEQWGIFEIALNGTSTGN